ncbi:hypothetical protein Pst134EA_006995 [Puccinia striiformis f. sp. tritici]|uniref:hypothetical protein n=1 Tax=Puccinia striiformis f. sp. tritici TaxID=168172 RepID=UPI00200753D8|nr:hypothetical protein Pst134EA_006995 [Puccinia striiformis f. sp. tritici]KAH9469714.1 hypothetical protein Pst134EA_006995 [Puccinia striiformis f. sp. tritici]
MFFREESPMSDSTSGASAVPSHMSDQEESPRPNSEVTSGSSGDMSDREETPTPDGEVPWWASEIPSNMTDQNESTRSGSEVTSGAGASVEPSLHMVLHALDTLGYRYHEALSRTFRPDENDRWNSELSERHNLIDELRSVLLPSIKEHLNSLLCALDLKVSGKHPCPDPELILETIPKFDQALEKITRSVQCISAPFPANFSHEFHLGRCKKFLRSRLHSQVRLIITNELCRLFYHCISFIPICKLVNDKPENLDHQTEMSKLKERVVSVWDDCHRSIDKTIKWLHKKPLGVLQEGWLEAEEKVTQVLETITKLPNPTINSGHRLDSTDTEVGQNTTRNPEAEHVLKVAKSTIPIIKLARILLNRLLEPSRKPTTVPFTMTELVDSDDLSSLCGRPYRIATRLEDLAGLFLRLHRANNGFGNNKQMFRSSIDSLFNTLDGSLNDLTFYLIPLPFKLFPRPQSNNQFAEWFDELKDLWRKATDNYLNTLNEGQYE